MKRLACLGLAAVVLAGCISTPDVGTHYDPYTHARTDLMSQNMLKGSEPVRELVWLNASRVFRTTRDYDYYLEVDYMALKETGFLDIPPGDTLTILADNQVLKFTGSGSSNSRREHADEVTEHAIYLATPQQLQAVAGAEKVKVSVQGRNGLVQRDFAPENFERFREFVQRYVTG